MSKLCAVEDVLAEKKANGLVFAKFGPHTFSRSGPERFWKMRVVIDHMTKSLKNLKSASSCANKSALLILYTPFDQQQLHHYHHHVG
jgi:hypothetical protein